MHPFLTTSSYETMGPACAVRSEPLPAPHAVSAKQIAPHPVTTERVDFVRELAVLIARSPSGQAAAWPVVETIQQDGICVEVQAPAEGLADELAAEATLAGLRLAGELAVTGVLAVEIFQTLDGGFVVEGLQGEDFKDLGHRLTVAQRLARRTGGVNGGASRMGRNLRNRHAMGAVMASFRGEFTERGAGGDGRAAILGSTSTREARPMLFNVSGLLRSPVGAVRRYTLEPERPVHGGNVELIRTPACPQ